MLIKYKINVVFGCSCQQNGSQSYAHYLVIVAYRYKIRQIRKTKSTRLQCIDTPKSQYCCIQVSYITLIM